MIDDRTAHLNLPLPHADNTLTDDVSRLRATIDALDALLSSDDPTLDTTQERVAAIKALRTDLAALDTALSGRVTDLDIALSGQVTTLQYSISDQISDLQTTVNGQISALQNSVNIQLAAIRTRGQVYFLSQS